jgi:hypothetical protein
MYYDILYLQDSPEIHFQNIKYLVIFWRNTAIELENKLLDSDYNMQTFRILLHIFLLFMS